MLEDQSMYIFGQIDRQIYLAVHSSLRQMYSSRQRKSGHRVSGGPTF